MNTSIATLCIAIAAIVSLPAHAQGELGDLPKTPAYMKRDPAQRAAAKAERRVEARDAARAGPVGELGPQPKAQPATHYSKAEKVAARSTRKAATVRANKSGEISSPGELGLSN